MYVYVHVCNMHRLPVDRFRFRHLMRAREKAACCATCIVTPGDEPISMPVPYVITRDLTVS
jgi:hypothetical protein